MATFERHVDVEWNGSVMEGGGTAKAGTGAFSLPVTFPSRIGEPAGKTSPEELMAAAHAACYAMALNGTIGRTEGVSVDRTVRARDRDRRQGRRRNQDSVVEARSHGVWAEGRRRGEVRRDREDRRRPLPCIECVPRHDADHGRNEGRLNGLLVPDA